jgi:hypothetical protein
VLTQVKQELVKIDRLGEEIVHTGFDCPLHVVRRGARGKRQDGDGVSLRIRFELTRGFKAIHARHHQIHDDGLRMERTDHVESLGAVRGGGGEVTGELQEVAERSTTDGLVIDNQYAVTSLFGVRGIHQSNPKRSPTQALCLAPRRCRSSIRARFPPEQTLYRKEIEEWLGYPQPVVLPGFRPYFPRRPRGRARIRGENFLRRPVSSVRSRSLMMRFRTSCCQNDQAYQPTSQRVDLDAVRRVVTDVMRPDHFFVRSSAQTAWSHQPREETTWEVYQGRLLDPAHTRNRKTFETWSLAMTAKDNGRPEPILTARLDAAGRQVYVTRAIYCHAWEGYHAGDNVYLSRPTKKWVQELVGTALLDDFSSVDEMRDELISLLFHAVVGTSRLPLTSTESPLPAFSLGELAYVYHSNGDTGSMGTASELIGRGLHADLSPQEAAKLLDALLRATPRSEIGDIIGRFFARWTEIGHLPEELPALYRRLFNEVALSPYTGFVANALASVDALVQRGLWATEEQVDFLSYLLRHNGRHLTAYDLETFHHRGANYPDALLLDETLRSYLELCECFPELFGSASNDSPSGAKRKRIRRRALRQAWLLWHLYEGLPVPDVPTSPGECTRVLPAPFGQVPEEQIVDPARRMKRLFADTPLPELLKHGRCILQQSMHDLDNVAELRELGMALYLDRPLGVLKPPNEPDQTPLFSYEAFSATVAQRRFRFLADKLGLVAIPDKFEKYQQSLNLPEAGIPLCPSGRRPRLGAVSLDDAFKISGDFVLLRSTRQTISAFLDLLPSSLLVQRASLLHPDEPLLIVDKGSAQPSPPGTILVFDQDFHERLRLQIDASKGYRIRAAVEFPVAGLRPI